MPSWGSFFLWTLSEFNVNRERPQVLAQPGAEPSHGRTPTTAQPAASVPTCSTVAILAPGTVLQSSSSESRFWWLRALTRTGRHPPNPLPDCAPSTGWCPVEKGECTSPASTTSCQAQRTAGSQTIKRAARGLCFGGVAGPCRSLFPPPYPQIQKH